MVHKSPVFYVHYKINIEYLVKNKTDLVHSMVSGAFLSLTKIISSVRILIVCTSCKTSYNVLSHSHWGLGQFFGGGGGGGGGGVIEIPGGSKKKTVSRF